MEILTDNYIWIIVIVVVILMTIIGYIAEKTNFGKKEFSKKKNNKKIEEKEMEVKAEEKKSEISSMPAKETSKVENTMEAVETPKELVKQVEKEPTEEVQFRDPLADDMNVASEALETPYEESKTEILPIEEDLNAPLEENISYNVPENRSFDVSEDLNAPFGDFEIPTERIVEENLNVPLTDDNSYNASYNIAEEDLNVPFGDIVKNSKEEDFGLNLPDIDSIKEDVSATANSENDDDDIWKF